MNTILKSRLGQTGLVAMGLTIAMLLVAANRGTSKADGGNTTRVEADRGLEKQLKADRRNVTRVLQADRGLEKQMEASIPKDAPPSVTARAVEHYCEGLEQLDMSNCPADFRVAYHEHMRAWREM